MPELETIYKCPVCLGVTLEKLRFKQETSGDEVLLDYCTRCGGMWFDHGEIQELRQIHQQHVKAKVILSEKAYFMQCHQCHQLMNRNHEKCQECQWKNIIDCPVCLKPMNRKDTLNLCLDYCRDCKGVWFDNIELAAIWNGYLHEVARHEHTNFQEIDDDLPFFVEVLCYSPDLTYYAMEPVVDIAASAITHTPELMIGAGEVLSNIPETAGSFFEAVPEIAGSAFEGIGDAAGSIFEFIAEIIGGLFS